MSFKNNPVIRTLIAGAALSLVSMTGAVTAAPDEGANVRADRVRVAEHWTGERRRNAIPRDLVIDSRGLGYLRKPSGSLEPYGHDIAPQAKRAGRPGGGGGGGGSDTTPPSITNMDPEAEVIGASHTFSATVQDDVGVKSVSFTIQYPGGATQSFNPTKSGTTWSIGLQGFTDGAWHWWVDAKDTAGKGGNRATSDEVKFTVDTGGGGEPPPDGDVITNAVWTTEDGTGGDVRLTAGRIYFEMPKNAKRKGPWQGFVCSGNVVTDAGPGRSVILTAAHCVYDDVNKAFARNVLFIPNQAGTTGSGTDLNCSNDPMGCWVPSWGAVDAEWTEHVFPANVAWDYAYYVVNDSGSHLGTGDVAALDNATGNLTIQFVEPSFTYTHALGYSFSDDPKLMYCAADMTTQGDDNWWLPNCGLSGGSSGGPWIQPMDEFGSGPVISVNSWGLVGAPGMAGPKLSGTSARCVFDVADVESDPTTTATVDGEAGIAVTCQ